MPLWLDLHSQREVLRSLPVAGSDHNLLVGVTGTSKRAGSAQGFPHSSVVPLGCQGSPPQRQAPGSHTPGAQRLFHPEPYRSKPNFPYPSTPKHPHLPPTLQSEEQGSHPILSNPVSCVQQQLEIPREEERSRHRKQGYLFQAGILLSSTLHPHRVCSSGTSRALRI